MITHQVISSPHFLIHCLLILPASASEHVSLFLEALLQLSVAQIPVPVPPGLLSTAAHPHGLGVFPDSFKMIRDCMS